MTTEKSEQDTQLFLERLIRLLQNFETELLIVAGDDYKCRRCGWTHSLWNRSDPRHLELHHIEAHVRGGENSEDNLITLCTVCHDIWHSVEEKWGDGRFFNWLHARGTSS